MKEMKQSKKCEKHPLRKVYSIHKEVRPMKTNLETIQDIVFYMEGHLEERLDLDSLCRVAGYSRYHLSRMFSAVAGFSVHTYIRRRRLTEAARLLVFTDKPVMEIALLAGYETQQSFTVGFKAMYKCSPLAYRRKREFCPLQLTLTVDGSGKLKGDMITDVQMVESGRILLAGYQKNTRLGLCNRTMLEKNARREGGDTQPDKYGFSHWPERLCTMGCGCGKAAGLFLLCSIGGGADRRPSERHGGQGASCRKIHCV